MTTDQIAAIRARVAVTRARTERWATIADLNYVTDIVDLLAALDAETAALADLRGQIAALVEEYRGMAKWHRGMEYCEDAAVFYEFADELAALLSTPEIP
jgi:hypothetical protein